VDSKTLNLLLIGAGIYAFTLIMGVARKIPDALTSVGEAIGSGLYDFFHPDPTGEMLFYTVRFPDGQWHTVPSKTVGSNGRFKFLDGITYQLLERIGEVGRNRYAVKV
jgi:hypothetical protein